MAKSNRNRTRSSLNAVKRATSEADESTVGVTNGLNDDNGSVEPPMETGTSKSGRSNTGKTPIKGASKSKKVEEGPEDDMDVDEDQEQVLIDDEEELAEGEQSKKGGNECIFCNTAPKADPTKNFIACAICGDQAHQECAVEQDGADEDDLDSWQCPHCVKNDMETAKDDDAVSNVSRASPSRLTKELLPQPRGGIKPGSHSVFAKLVLDDDPMDGSRPLRKRKSLSYENAETSEKSLKRKKAASAEPVKIREATPPVEQPSEPSPPSPLPAPELLQPPLPSRTASARKRKSEAISTAVETPPVRKIPIRIRAPPIRLPNVWTVKKTSDSYVIGIRATLPSTALKKKSSRPRPSQALVPVEKELETPTQATPHTTHFYSFHERENDELKAKPYGGILTEIEADTTKTMPTEPDRQRFNDAKRKAEELQKARIAHFITEHGDQAATSQKLSGPPSKVKYIHFGGWEIETWYAAPYPEEYSRNPVLHICEFCLKYMNSNFVAWRHKLKCPAKFPPGDEIYRDGSISVFEVDGRKNPVYCQNLCLLAKLFLGSKTLYYDVEPFLFYVMCEYDETGYHFVGYFSKEKRIGSMNNVSCILTLPIHQRKGYGHLLIDFSYLLTRTEGKTGSPEKPLSDMGLVSYRNYWRLTLSKALIDQRDPFSIIGLANKTGMTPDDIVAALEGLRALVRDPITKSYAFRLDYDFFKDCIEKWEKKGYQQLNPDKLVWTPFILGRTTSNQYDHTQAISTVAPRDDGLDDEEEPLTEDTKTATMLRQNSGQDPAVPDVDEDALMKIENIDQVQAETNGYSASLKAASTKLPPEPIPPSRYEIFPPLPGMKNTNSTPRRGRPFSTVRKGSRPTTTPRRRTTQTSTRARGDGEAGDQVDGSFESLPMPNRSGPRRKTTRKDPEELRAIKAAILIRAREQRALKRKKPSKPRASASRPRRSVPSNTVMNGDLASDEIDAEGEEEIEDTLDIDAEGEIDEDDSIYAAQTGLANSVDMSLTNGHLDDEDAEGDSDVDAEGEEDDDAQYGDADADAEGEDEEFDPEADAEGEEDAEGSDDYEDADGEADADGSVDESDDFQDA